MFSSFSHFLFLVVHMFGILDMFYMFNFPYVVGHTFKYLFFTSCGVFDFILF